MDQANQDKIDYFDYLNSVLGIKTILQDVIVEDRKPQTTVLFVVEDYKNYSPSELELLKKMIAAVKLDVSLYKICDVDQALEIDSKICVLFQDEFFVKIPEKEIQIQTFSPRTLLLQPELKKVAWAELQKLKVLKTSQF